MLVNKYNYPNFDFLFFYSLMPQKRRSKKCSKLVGGGDDGDDGVLKQLITPLIRQAASLKLPLSGSGLVQKLSQFFGLLRTAINKITSSVLSAGNSVSNAGSTITNLVSKTLICLLLAVFIFICYKLYQLHMKAAKTFQAITDGAETSATYITNLYEGVKTSIFNINFAQIKQATKGFVGDIPSNAYNVFARFFKSIIEPFLNALAKFKLFEAVSDWPGYLKAGLAKMLKYKNGYFDFTPLQKVVAVTAIPGAVIMKNLISGGDDSHNGANQDITDFATMSELGTVSDGDNYDVSPQNQLQGNFLPIEEAPAPTPPAQAQLANVQDELIGQQKQQLSEQKEKLSEQKDQLRQQKEQLDQQKQQLDQQKKQIRELEEELKETKAKTKKNKHRPSKEKKNKKKRSRSRSS